MTHGKRPKRFSWGRDDERHAMITRNQLKAISDRFNRKLRELYSGEKGRKMIEAEATAAAVILGEPMKHKGQKAAFGNEPVQEIHFDGIERPTRFKLRMRHNEFARVTWQRDGQTVQAWIKVGEDGRWIVGAKQIMGMNKECRNERETSSAGGQS
jgi:hypothetical protein